MNWTKKTIPSAIQAECEKALSYFPELSEVDIEFKFNKITVQSYMLAQPKPNSLIFHRSRRKYRVLINRRFFLQNKQFEDGRIPFDVLTGWLGHELGHILDYKDRSSINLVFFGIRYHFFKTFLKRAEITADYNAVKAGMIDYIVVSKEFGRNPKYFPASYIAKLMELYPPISMVKQWASELTPTKIE